QRRGEMISNRPAAPVSIKTDSICQTAPVMHALSTVHRRSPRIVFHDKSSRCTLCRNTGGPLMWRHQGCSLS
ncbi:putative tRNA pseudouridine synthase 1, partial [Clarias magur]